MVCNKHLFVNAVMPHKYLFKLMVAAIFAFMTGGCIIPSSLIMCPCQWYEVEGLCRSNLKKWKIYELHDVGVKFEAPVDLKYFSWVPANDPRWEPDVYMCFHALNPPVMVLDDVIYVIKIKIHKVPKERFQKGLLTCVQSEDYAVADESQREQLCWFDTIHNKTARLDKKGSTYYRRDIELPNGDFYWSSSVEKLNISVRGKRIFEQEDDAAIRRILDSVTPL